MSSEAESTTKIPAEPTRNADEETRAWWAKWMERFGMPFPGDDETGEDEGDAAE